jgi:GTP-binding protein Era
LQEVTAAIVSHLPEGGPLYEADMFTDRSERYFASELIREAIFTEFQEEIPYSTTVAVVEFKRRKKVYIQAEITVERTSQKAIIIGQRGESLKRIGQLARKRIEELVESPVYLDLWVKVRQGWRNNARDVRELEYGQDV